MMKNVRLFFCVLVLGIVTLAPPAQAAPITHNIGSAAVTLFLAPDPPVAGNETVTVLVTGVPNNNLRSTHVQFTTAMPSMSMNGPSGAARNAGLGQWTFDIDLGMAAPWNVTLNFSGGLRGSATYNVEVAAAKTNSGSSSALAAMSPAGDWTAWRTAAFVLLGLGLLALVVLRRDRRTGTIALFAAAAVVVIGVAMIKAQYGSAPMDMNAMENVAGSAPVAVRSIRVRSGTQGTAVSAPGTVSPYLTQTVVARASGLLSDFNVYNGDKVQAGQQIAYLNEPELGSSAAAAQAAAQSAQIEAVHHAPNDVRMAHNDITAKQRAAQYWSQEIARERTLLREGAVSQQEYQNEVAQAASAQADLRNALIKLSDAAASVGQARAQYSQAQNEAQTQSILAAYRSVVAPDDAVIVKRLVDPGTYVQAGTPIAQIAVLDKLRVQANVAQGDLQKIGLGDLVDVVLPTGALIHGRVSSIQPVADPATHTAMVEAIVENPHDRLQPGGYVRVTIHARGTANNRGDAIPTTALVGGANGSLVYVITDGAAQPVRVNVLSNDGATAIVLGLHSGARVITDGAADLQPGQLVTEIHS
jgi:multidrug efflux pump subunit AcrA (membrane-fusion protein)